MKTRSLLRFAVIGIGLLAASALRADDAAAANTSRTKFSDASKPGTLKVSLPWADVKVTGTDGDEIIVTSSLEEKGKREVDEEGFRRLDEEVSFEIVEKNNVATLVMSGDNPWAAHGAEFSIQVPRQTNLILHSEAGGDVKVERLNGDIDINATNSEIQLVDIGSSAVVNTMNGEVTAIFKQAPAKPVSISSMNGEIDVRLPADTKANLRLRSHNGSIRTNFPEGALVTKTEKNTGPDKGYSYSFSAPRSKARPVAAPQPAPAPEPVEAAAAPEAPEPPALAETEEERKAVAALPPAERVRHQARLAELHVTHAALAAQAALADAARQAARMTAGAFGKSITGTLNGGGVDIQLSTMNGTITLRQVK